jgi:hypothetical protein
MILIQQLDQSPFCWKEVSPLDKKSPFFFGEKIPWCFPGGIPVLPLFAAGEKPWRNPQIYWLKSLFDG